MQKKKKKVKKQRVRKDANTTENPVTDQDARGHTGGYGGATGSGMKGNITKANKGSTGTRGR